ncbi:MAG: cytochrome c551/c552 [Comamonadaceae bacterium]|nr:MAG: cytochrome c551/c552 [Comamonadaceae bacterium]
MMKLILFGKLALVLISRVIFWGSALISLPSLARNEFQVCNSHSMVRGSEIAVDRGCLGCHTLGVKRVGPTYSDIANRYEHNPATELFLASKIKHGSIGAWGAAVMPANAISDEEALMLARWILTLRSAPPPESQFSSRLQR